MTYNLEERDCRDCDLWFVNFMGPWCKKSGKPVRLSHDFWDNIRTCEAFIRRSVTNDI